MVLQGIGNGLPLAAVVTTPEIAAVMKERIHFNTFGANPMCAAGGRAVLKTLIEDGYQQNCAKVNRSSHVPTEASLETPSHASSGFTSAYSLGIVFYRFP